jgi:hypothetical protein
MHVTNGTDGTETPRKKKRQKTGGRRRGTPNKVTKEFGALRQSCQEIFKETLGLEMKVDPETGKPKINGKAVTVRQRLEKMFQGKIPVDRGYLELLKFGMAYAYGTPLKMQPAGDGKPRMPYIGRHGLPWQYDPMADQQRLAIEAQRDQEKIDSQARQRQLQGLPVDQVDDEDDGEAPEVVRG